MVIGYYFVSDAFRQATLDWHDVWLATQKHVHQTPPIPQKFNVCFDPKFDKEDAQIGGSRQDRLELTFLTILDIILHAIKGKFYSQIK